MGTSSSINCIPTTTESTSWLKSELDILHSTYIACFSMVSSVEQYLTKFDSHFDVDPNISQDEQRKLPNKPALIVDILKNMKEKEGIHSWQHAQLVK